MPTKFCTIKITSIHSYSTPFQELLRKYLAALSCNASDPPGTAASCNSLHQRLVSTALKQMQKLPDNSDHLLKDYLALVKPELEYLNDKTLVRLLNSVLGAFEEARTHCVQCLELLPSILSLLLKKAAANGECFGAVHNGCPR